MVILASTLWQPVLSVGGPARLYDTQHDGWLPEPEGVLTADTTEQVVLITPEFLSLCVILLIFSKVWRGCSAAAAFTAR